MGTLVGGLAAESRARELITPLLLLPLLVPVAIAGASATRRCWSPRPNSRGWAMAGRPGLYGMVFVLLSVAVFDYLMED